MNFTSGTRSNADYTWPEMGGSYVSSDVILKHLKSLETNGRINGAVLLIHAGTDPRRKDKFYNRLPELISYLRKKIDSGREPMIHTMRGAGYVLKPVG